MTTERQYRKALAAARHHPDDDQARRALNVRLCSTSYAGWAAFAVANGVTMASLIDHMGHALAVHAAGGDLAAVVAPQLAEAVLAARELDASRRQRR